MINKVNFLDTEKAYKAKSNKSLNKALWLFKMMNIPFFSKMGISITIGIFKLGFNLKRIIRATLYEQFIGGDNLDVCVELSKDLSQYNVQSILDYATEGGTSEEEINDVINEIYRNIEVTANNKNMPFAVFKPSAFASDELLEKFSNKAELNEEEKKALDKMKKRYDQIFEKAAEHKVKIMIDAEESWTQPIVDELILEQMRKHNKERVIAINTFQLYRKDRLDKIKEFYEIAKKEDFFLGVKIVRGAYIDKERKRAKRKGYPSPIHETKKDTDSHYNKAFEFCAKHNDRVLIFSGTHNEESNYKSMELMKKLELKKDNQHIHYSQLFGMCDHITFNMADAGYNISKYIPYGSLKIATPYLLRRAQENNSVASQAKTEIALIKKERKRRKKIS